MAPPLSWYLLSTGMFICLIICVSLIIIQVRSLRWYSVLKDDDSIYKGKRELLFLYGVYIAGIVCSLQCLLNHVSSYFPDWYCEYGMGICVIFHELAKTFGYGYFMERSNKMTKLTGIQCLSPVVQQYVLPVYIFCYFLMYSVMCPLEFRGLSLDPATSTSPTSCLFDEYESWVFYLSVGVEVVNSCFFVFLFGYPLYKLIDPRANMDIVTMIRWNVILSLICCISSVTFLIYRAMARHSVLGYYLWMAGNVDLVFNALAIFAMSRINRKFIAVHLCVDDSRTPSSTPCLEVTSHLTTHDPANKSLIKSTDKDHLENTITTDDHNKTRHAKQIRNPSKTITARPANVSSTIQNSTT
eukprot:619856_1